ncbi:nuclear transport factor 2 family protein [Cellulosimicrobium terreum]|nr:nuclear transport factor 2 family protein [Cellulosimicrobium terreum]
MTGTRLPTIVQRYFELAPTTDHEALVALFGDEAVVEDEGSTCAGVDAVRAWRAGSVPVEYEITDVTERAGGVVVTATITGDFPGSPVPGLRFEFGDLTGGRINTLSIGL